MSVNSRASDNPALPRHVEETVESIKALHLEHSRSATRSERAVDYATGAVSRPAFIAIICTGSLAWVAVNIILPYAHVAAPDPPPFVWLVDILTFLGVLIAVLIVTTQRRASKLADLREKMTLELGLLTEQKTAKMIALLEELRRDSPTVPDRVDHEARDMAQRADAASVRDAIEDPAAS